MSDEVTQADRDAAHEWMRGQSTGLRMMMVKPRGLYEAFARHRLQAKASKDTEIQQAVAAEVAQIVAGLKSENGQCDCSARSEGECACGAWDDYKTWPLERVWEWIERGEYKGTSGE